MNGLFSLEQLERNGLIELGRGQIINKDDMNSCSGSFPVYSSSAQNNGEFSRYGKYMFDDERITWSIDGGGKLLYRPRHKYSVINVCGWLKVTNENILLTKYLYYSLIFQWKKKEFDYTYKANPSVIKNIYTIDIIPIKDQIAIVIELTKIEKSILKKMTEEPFFDELVKSQLIVQEILV